MAVLTREQKREQWRRVLARNPGVTAAEVSAVYEAAVQAVEDSFPDIAALLFTNIDLATAPVVLPTAVKRAIAVSVIRERVT